jgi:PilZ domain
MTERRNELRLKGSGLAKIAGTDRETEINCTILDISVSGGCIEVDALIKIPESFQLVPADDDSSGYPCRVVWRKDSRVGFEFDE